MMLHMLSALVLLVTSVAALACDTVESNEAVTPAVEHPIGTQLLGLDDGVLRLSLEDVFSSGSEDGIAFEGQSLAPDVVSATTEGPDLLLEPVAEGEADVVVTARTSGGTATDQFTVVVESAVAAVDLSLEVSDGASAQRLRFGLDPEATEGIDEALGEAELPPLPPGGVFEARLVGEALGEGSYRDYREGDGSFVGEVAQEVRFQRGEGRAEVTFTWDWPDGVRAALRDVITGGDVFAAELTGAGRVTVENENLERLQLLVRYE